MVKPGFLHATPVVAAAVVLTLGVPAATAQDASATVVTPASRPAASPPQATTRPAATDSGVVGAALQELYVIPRDSGDAPYAGAGDAKAQSAPRSKAASGALPAREQRSASAKRPPSTAPAAGRDREPGTTNAGSGQPPVTNSRAGTPAHFRTGRRLSTNDREWANYRYFGGQPSRYGYGMYDYNGGYRSYGGYGPYGGYDDGDVYRFGFMQGYDKGQFDRTSNERAESVAAHASLNVSSGLQFFRKGEYRKAADAYQLAAELDQGDPAARLCAGHALFALGRYREAARFIRRAFELQPRVAYLAYDIRGDYENRADFDEHLQALRKALDLAPRDPDRLFMLGYVLYYSNQRANAYAAFAQLLQVDKNDKLAASLYHNAQPSDVEADAARAAAQQTPAK